MIIICEVKLHWRLSFFKALFLRLYFFLSCFHFSGCLSFWEFLSFWGPPNFCGHLHIQGYPHFLSQLYFWGWYVWLCDLPLVLWCLVVLVKNSLQGPHSVEVGEWLLKLLTRWPWDLKWPVGPSRSSHMNCTGNRKCTQETEF